MNKNSLTPIQSVSNVKGLLEEGAVRRHVTGTQRRAGADELLTGSCVAGRSLSFRQTVNALVNAPHFRALARALPDPQGQRPGPKTKYPVEMYLLYEQLLAFTETQARLDAELRDPVFWSELCDLFERRFNLVMPRDRPITRRHMETWRKAMTLGYLDEHARPVLRAQAFDMSRQMGLLRVRDDVDWTNLSPDNVISGDGTWLKPWSEAEIKTNGDEKEVRRSRATKLSRVRQAEDVVILNKDGRKVKGRGYVGFHTRTDVAGQRITLDLAPIPKSSGEIGTARHMLNTLIEQAEGGIHGVTYDGAVDAGDIRRLMEMGVVPIVPVQASSKTNIEAHVPDELVRYSTSHDTRTRNSTVKKRCRVAPIKLVSHLTDEGTRCEHHLWAYDGDVVVAKRSGHRLNVSYLCELVSRKRTEGFKRFEFSLTVQVPCVHGSFTATVNPHGVYNAGSPLASALRLVAHSHDDYRRLTGRRNDSESAWATLKANLANQRSSRLKHAPEYLYLLAAVTAFNAIAYDNFRRSAEAM